MEDAFGRALLVDGGWTRDLNGSQCSQLGRKWANEPGRGPEFLMQGIAPEAEFIARAGAKSLELGSYAEWWCSPRVLTSNDAIVYPWNLEGVWKVGVLSACLSTTQTPEGHVIVGDLISHFSFL